MIYILSKERAIDFSEFIKKDSYNVIIRITDVDSSFQELKEPEVYRDILTLKFNDTIREINSSFNYTHLKRVINFFEKHTNPDNFVIHCDGGVSRSSGIAVGYCLYKQNEAGLNQIFKNGNYYPNSRIVSMFAKNYGYDKEYINKFYQMLDLMF